MAKNQINSTIERRDGNPIVSGSKTKVEHQTLETKEEKPKANLLRNAEKDVVVLIVEPTLKFKIAKSLLCLEILNPRSQMSWIDLA